MPLPHARAAIFKFIDNIMALYAHVAAMMLVVICSILFLGFKASTTFVCGFAVCIISLFLYHHQPPPETTPSPIARGSSASTSCTTLLVAPIKEARV